MELNSYIYLYIIIFVVPSLIIDCAIPILNLFLTASTDWRSIESAILCVGALKESKDSTTTKLFEQYIPAIFQYYSHQQPFIRQILSWTISRYAEEIIRDYDKSTEEDSLFTKLIPTFLLLCNDEYQSVRTAAFSSLAATIEKFTDTKVKQHYFHLDYVHHYYIYSYKTIIFCIIVVTSLLFFNLQITNFVFPSIYRMLYARI